MQKFNAKNAEMRLVAYHSIPLSIPWIFWKSEARERLRLKIGGRKLCSLASYGTLTTDCNNTTLSQTDTGLEKTPASPTFAHHSTTCPSSEPSHRDARALCCGVNECEGHHCVTAQWVTHRPIYVTVQLPPGFTVCGPQTQSR